MKTLTLQQLGLNEQLINGLADAARSDIEGAYDMTSDGYASIQIELATSWGRVHSLVERHLTEEHKQLLCELAGLNYNEMLLIDAEISSMGELTMTVEFEELPDSKLFAMAKF